MSCNVKRFNHHLHPDLAVSVFAAWSAGNVVRARFDEVYEVEEKGRGDFVTRADKEANVVICDALRKCRPDYGICSEEGPADGIAVDGKLFIVDSLDGTNAFVHRIDRRMPAVLIALEVDGQVVASVVHFPLTDETFYAVEGKGAFRGDGTPVTTAWAGEIEFRRSWVEMNHHIDWSLDTRPFKRLWLRLRSQHGVALVTQGPPYSGVSVRMAEGDQRVIAAIHDNNSAAPAKQALWDVAAPALILREAGGVVLNMRGEPYNPRQHEPFICAANRGIADQILALL